VTAERLADVAGPSTVELLTITGWPAVVYRSHELSARSGRSERFADLSSRVGHHILAVQGGSRYLDHAPVGPGGCKSRCSMDSEPPRAAEYQAWILAKFSLRDRIQAVVLAFESRLITPGRLAPRTR
jgi:hypothetical protein